MLESIFRLGYKARAGLTDAQNEIKNRINTRFNLPLEGLHGETLCLTAVEELNQKASSVRQLYERIPHRRKAKDVILLDAWTSATIEGARTTVERVRQSFENPDSKDEKMVINTVHGSNYAYQHPITPKNIRRLWEIVVKDVCENQNQAGIFYRDGMVYIGNDSKTIHTPAEPEQIEPKMSQLFQFAEKSELDPLLTSFVFHFCFVYIHPFCDGNGRTARILNSSQLYQSGFKKMKHLPLSSAINDSLKGYYHSLTESEYSYSDSDGSKWMDLSPFVSYMLDVFEKCLVNSSLAENKLNDSESRLLERMNKVGPKAEITVKKAMGILKLSESGTRKVLNTLAAKGYLTIEKGQKAYLYRLEPNLSNIQFDF